MAIFPWRRKKRGDKRRRVYLQSEADTARLGPIRDAIWLPESQKGPMGSPSQRGHCGRDHFARIHVGSKGDEEQWLVQVFIVDTRANKRQIKDSVHRLYDIQTKKVNTLIRYISAHTLLHNVTILQQKCGDWTCSHGNGVGGSQ